MASMIVVPLWASLRDWAPPILNVLLLLASGFLILLVLIQRGKGGGLAGAFGGAGGSSAFGSRAGDVFTRVTIYTAAVWVFLIMFLIKTTQETGPLRGSGEGVENRQRDTGGTPED